MVETLVEQVDKLSIMFDYISNQVGDDKAGKICTKLGLDNPHFSRMIDIEKYKRLADKMIKFNNIVNNVLKQK